MKLRLILIASVLGITTLAAEGALVKLDHAPIKVGDHEMVLRGAKHFKQQCMLCHSMRYLRYDAISKEAGITLENMPKWDDLSWGGHPPPDLSLVVKRRTADWLYTFLRAYYVDPTRPTGANNLVWPNTSMPNPFSAQQGLQKLLISEAQLKDLHGSVRWSEVLELEKSGKMTGEQFDQYIDDIVNYLVYASDPSAIKRQEVGKWVIGYLLILLLFALMLSINYWDEIKRKHYREKD